VLIYARGGAYGAGTETENLDYQKTYMQLVLGFIGFSEVQSVVIEPTLMVTPEEKGELIEKANAEARGIAESF
jgi:FMN-dependent NADH-azoreductase